MNNTITKTFTTLDTRFGTVVFAADDGRIFSVRVMTDDGRFGPDRSWRRSDDEFIEARGQLAAYLAGELREFSLPLEMNGTAFQKLAWSFLQKVPYAATTTYGELAEAMGRPGTSRAVGHAMNRNPISIIVPCHRVVGKNGSLTGYLNGVDMKRSLLAMEAACRRSGREPVVAT